MESTTSRTGTRFDYIKYDDRAFQFQALCKTHMCVIELFLNNLPDSREKSLAITRLEEAYMWVGKAIREDQIQRNGVAELQEGRKDS